MAWLLGGLDWDHAWEGNGRDGGMGEWGLWPLAPKARPGKARQGTPWVPDSAVGTGRSTGALTREGEEDDTWRGSAKAKPRQKIKRKQTHHHPMTLRKLRLG